MSETNGRSHTYHAEASVLEGHLELPLVQRIHPQAYAKLPDEGGYLSQRVKDYRLESVISYRSAHTQVAGNRDVKPGHGWATLTTSVVEGLNILDVLTADRVVGQVATEHPLVGYVPSISFLGTRFENLRIAGHPVDLDMDLDILGSRPETDTAYSSDSGFTDRVKAQYGRILEQQQLPSELHEKYNLLSKGLGGREAVECSLVNRAAGGYPGICFGHVIAVPNFGRITLGKLTLHHEDFKTDTDIPEKTTLRLTMIDLKFGCAIGGSGGVGMLSTNGTSRP
ncbi:MAG: hypothetical protein ABSG96_24560 [Terracidiphilus sp.]|jgi:hypothetical protein